MWVDEGSTLKVAAPCPYGCGVSGAHNCERAAAGAPKKKGPVSLTMHRGHVYRLCDQCHRKLPKTVKEDVRLCMSCRQTNEALDRLRSRPA